MKVFLLVCFSATTLADQPEYKVGYDYVGNGSQAYNEYYAKFFLADDYNVSEEYSEQILAEIKNKNKISEAIKINETTKTSDEKSPSAIPNKGMPPNRKTISCETWTADVLDCSDQNRQSGQKGEKGDPGRDSKGAAGVPGEVGVEGPRGPRGGDGKAGRDGRHGNDGGRGEEGEAGPGCDREELEEMRRRNKMMEEEFEEASKDGELAEEEYEELKRSYDEVHHLMYKLMGGLVFISCLKFV